MRTRHSMRNDDGAAAVEFALVLPVLIILVLGLIEFSLVFNSQISLTSAAREGARVMAIENDPAAARTATINAAPAVNPAVTAADITITPADCGAGETVTVTIDYNADLVTGFFGTNFDLRGQGVMLCGG